MIEFLTLFLGIVAGPQQVSLLVDPQVATIELRLDGETLIEMEGPPWEVEIDLGNELLPHVLETVGFDADGVEVARTAQLLNVPRPAAEVSLMPQREPDGRLAAQLAWESATGAGPTEKIALLDEEEVPILGGDRVDLSGSDIRQLHVLQLELWFADLTSARGHLVFGGEYVDETSAELTALPVLPTKGVLKASAMAGWFVADSESIRVAAVEKGLASLMIVRGPGVSQSIQSLIGTLESTPQGQSSGLGSIQGRIDPTTAELQRSALPFGDDIRVRLVAPEHCGHQASRSTLISSLCRPKSGQIRVGCSGSCRRKCRLVARRGATFAGRRDVGLTAGGWERPSPGRSANSGPALGGSQSVRGGYSTRLSRGSECSPVCLAHRRWGDFSGGVGLDGIHLPNAVQMTPDARIESVVGDNQD